MQRSLRSFSWTAGAQIIVVGVGFVRSVLLARLLDVETFGIYAGALAIVGLLLIPAGLGISGAYMHRTAETTDENRATAVYFTIQIVLALLWGILMTAAALYWTSGATRTAILVMIWTSAVELISAPPSLLLMRRVQMQRLAQTQIAVTLVASLASVLLAWNGIELWALLSGEILTSLVFVISYFLWKPFWKVRFAYDRTIVEYYMRFGIPYMFSSLVETALQRLDDLYVRYRLGLSQMGFYSRAYTFANYPRSILAVPITSVAGSAFAELGGDRVRLSKAFFRTASLLIRSSFLLGGLLVLIAPEFIAILLGDKWLPMVPIFRLFVVFVLLDPLRDVLSSLFVALGLPQRLLANRLIQLVILVTGLWLLGERWGAEGVAVAVNLMMVAGTVLLFSTIRPHLDFSLRRMFGTPLFALLAGALATIYAVNSAWMPANAWGSILVKSALFCGIYCLILFTVERNEMREIITFTWGRWKKTADNELVRGRASSVTVPEDIYDDPSRES